MELRPDRQEARALVLSMTAFWAALVPAGLVARAWLVLAAPFGLAEFLLMYRVAARESGLPLRTLVFVTRADPRWRDVRRVRWVVRKRGLSPRWLSLVARQTGWPHAAVVVVLVAAFAAGLVGWVALVAGYLAEW